MKIWLTKIIENFNKKVGKEKQKKLNLQNAKNIKQCSETKTLKPGQIQRNMV